MSPHTWKTLLQQWIARQNRVPRIAVLGIGNPLRSDDAAGVQVVRGLQNHFTRDLDSVLVIDAGQAPENHTAELRRFRPELVLLIDAAEMGLPPGEIRWVGIDEIDGMSASTHTLPLSMLAKYLTMECSCDVDLLGIQPRSVEIGESVSADVLRAVDEIAEELAGLLLAESDLTPVI